MAESMGAATVHIDSHRVDFEKWHALGNDYVIVDGEALPFALTEARIRAICAAHTGIGSDGILMLTRTDEAGFAAALRIFNPDGSEAELSGNGAREAILYMRRAGWVDANEFAVRTPTGQVRAQITSPSTCTVDMGHARVQSRDYPAGAADGRGELTADGHSWRFQFVQVGNPQCSIRVTDERALDQLDLPSIGPSIEHHKLFPNRTNISWFTALAPDRIRARIFERGVGETSASGTGATGAAVAHVLSGGASPVTVVLDGGELEVEVGEDLHINLTGWAVPVFAGTLADDFVKELHETE
jgi:diaminopimelate epimerase